MKSLLLCTALLAACHANAQDLAYKIPKDATVVASLKGEKLIELMSIPEFNQSFLAKKMLQEAKRKDGAGNYNSVEDFGIKLNSTVYYYLQQTDSISYNCILFSIADANKFEQKFNSSRRENITHNGNTRTLHQGNGKSMLIWNNETACLVFGNLNNNNLEDDSVRAQRYGLKKVSYSDYYYGDAAVDTVVAADYTETVEMPADMDATDTVAIDVAMPAVEAVAATPLEDSVYEEKPAPPIPEDNMLVEAPAENYRVDGEYGAAQEEQRKIRDKLTTEWVTLAATETFNKTAHANSILDNADYLHSLDDDATATFYLANVQGIYNSILPYYLGRGHFGNAMQGYGSINGKLFLNQEQIRITTEMQVDEEKAASYKRMINHKPNKKFAKYVNSDKMIGFMSYSFDTEEYLKELPRLMDQTYGRFLGLYQDEIGIGAELFSLLLDEKAVAKVIKGDALLLLTDVGPKEYTYTTYDYDEDYQRTDVKKTKTETLPEFLFMMSSDDTKLLERVLHYGIKKEKIVLKNGIYTLDNKVTRGNPFSLHILIKDGIIFCGTSYRDIQQISTDNFQGNISKEQKNLLLKNNAALYFNPKNMVGKITEKEFGNYQKLRDFNTLLGGTGQMYGKTTGIKKNRISGEMVAEVPAGKGNGLKYFLSLIDQASKLD